MTPEEQRTEDIEWLRRELVDAMHSRDAGGYRHPASRYRRILAALSARQEPFGWYVQRLSDGTGTLVFGEPAYSPGTQVVTPLFAYPHSARQEPSPDEQAEREMQEAWTRDLEEAVADAILTLQTEVDAGTAVPSALDRLIRVGPVRRTATEPTPS